MIALIAYLSPRAAQEEIKSGTLSVHFNENAAYYPAGGQLPLKAPPAYPEEQAISHCDEWVGWANEVEASATSLSMLVTTLASTTSPTTILDVDVTVFNRTVIQEGERIRCQYGAGGYWETTLYVDLESPMNPKAMDIDGDGEPDTSLPGGRFTVDSEVAEVLSIQLSGAADTLYDFGLEFDVVENGVRRTESFGTPEDPLSTVVEDSIEDNRDFDWDFATSGWIPARYPG